MKQILVIGSLTTHEHEKTALQAMATFIQDAMTDVTGNFCHLDEVGYVIDNNEVLIYDLHNGHELKEYDLVLFRGKLAASINVASTISTYLLDNNVPTVNTAYAKRRAVGKIPQMMQLASLGLRIPRTVVAGNKYLPEFIKGKLDYPMVVKDTKGAHGNNNYLVHSDEQLQEILDLQPDLEFMAQEYIPNDGDMRVLLVGPKHHMVIYRQSSTDSHLNNTSQGATASILDESQVSNQIIEESRRFAELCEYEIAGVDVMLHRDTNEHYFLEINSQPQIASGAFVAEKQHMIGSYLDSLLTD